MAATKKSKATKSKGHLFFGEYEGTKYEIYQVGNDIFKAPLSNVIDLDTGNRIGRWEAPATDRFLNELAASWGIINPPKLKKTKKGSKK